MNNKTEIFIKKSNIIHKGRYIYKTNYINSNKHVMIICKIHGDFYQTPTKHLKGRGCQECGGTKKMNWDNFLSKVEKIHNSKYVYTKQYFKNGRSKIDIICREHGIFKQSIESHLTGKGCPLCGGSKKNTNETLLYKFNKKHNGLYQYNIINYENNKSIIDIFCNKHGFFKMSALNHISGQGCKKCSLEKLSKTNEDFISICNKVHLCKYKYDKTLFKNNNSNIIIFCTKHGYFTQNARNHLRGSGCARCNESIGERTIEDILIRKGLGYKKQFKFKDCSYKRELPFDFYLYDKKICIEYDGKQHFGPVEYFGGEEKYKLQILRDNIKNEYCKENGIKIFRISYNDNIEEKLIELFDEI